MVEVWTVAPAACAPELVARGTLHVAVAVGFALTKRFVAATDEGEFAGNEADEIASGFFDVLERRIKLWKKYHGRIKKQLSPERAGQFVQIENQIALFVDLNIASEMPVIEAPSEP